MKKQNSWEGERGLSPNFFGIRISSIFCHNPFLKAYFNNILASTIRSSCRFNDHNFVCFLYFHYVNHIPAPSIFLHSITQSLSNRQNYLWNSLLWLNFKCHYPNHRQPQLGCIISQLNARHPLTFPLCRDKFCNLLGWGVSKNVFVGKFYILYSRLPWQVKFQACHLVQTHH